MAVFLTLVLGSAAARPIGLLGVDYLDNWPRGDRGGSGGDVRR